MALGWLLTFEFVLYSEVGRLQSRLLNESTTGEWWNQPDLDTTLFLPLLALAPFCWLFPWRWAKRQNSRVGMLPSDAAGNRWPSRVKLVSVCAVCALLALNTCVLTRYRQWTVGPERIVMAEVTPVVHDEFSYLLQARTMLAGRWSWEPPGRCPELFQPMHVLCGDAFASRYFPGTGLWLVPWLAMGVPIVGMWFAAMLVSAGMVLVGTRAADFRTGVIAAILTAVAPGICLFSNLFLSHLPTLVGLTLFLIGMLGWIRDSQQRSNAWLAGAGLSYAMLCRPLTAAAIGLPFGIWFLWRGLVSLRGSIEERQNWRRGCLGLGVPLLCGLALLGWQNDAITGNPLLTPYTQFNRIHTPRHAYGFGNGSRVSVDPERVFRDYDGWADDLNWSRAIENARKRFWSGWQWSLGIVPLMLAGLAFLFSWSTWSLGLRLCSLSIVSLHAVYFPYWLDGMLSHHYVFESGLLWILILSAVVSRWIGLSIECGRELFPIWCAALLAAGIVPNHFAVGSPATPARMATGLQQMTSANRNYRRFESVLSKASLKLPALVVVEPARADLHVEYVRNSPTFDDELLIGVNRHRRRPIEEIVKQFPDRTVYVYDSSSGVLTMASSTALDEDSSESHLEREKEPGPTPEEVSE